MRLELRPGARKNVLSAPDQEFANRTGTVLSLDNYSAKEGPVSLFQRTQSLTVRERSQTLIRILN